MAYPVLFNTLKRLAGITTLLLAAYSMLPAQPITGVWRGQITKGTGLRKKSAPVEIKFIKTGDSLLGTAYYYGSGKNFIRYSLKGYFDPAYNTVHWQDYQLIEKSVSGQSATKAFTELMKAEADFSCPDGKTMRLDGSCTLPGEPAMEIALKKVEDTFFPDEWVDLIAGYFTGMAEQTIIDSVWNIASEGRTATNTTVPPDVAATAPPPQAPPPQPAPKADLPKKDSTGSTGLEVVKIPEAAAPLKPQATVVPAPVGMPATVQAKPPAKVNAPPADITSEVAKQNSAAPAPTPVTTPVEKVPVPPPPPPLTAPQGKAATGSPAQPVVTKPAQPVQSSAVIETAFTIRKRVIQTQIPVVGDSVELRFYDNAEVDGDSISLFLNGKIIFQHIKLDVRPYTLRLAITDLPAESELTMVAENLGAIPPNTAYMEAIVQGVRYTARLESTEVSSGVIRLYKRE
ncbi:MAG: hypothetical protein MUF24_12400 [Chitinophagaceae bacterium]|nr:hypothetical protein [Chitinophagaceae bacterium]